MFSYPPIRLINVSELHHSINVYDIGKPSKHIHVLSILLPLTYNSRISKFCQTYWLNVPTKLSILCFHTSSFCLLDPHLNVPMAEVDNLSWVRLMTNLAQESVKHDSRRLNFEKFAIKPVTFWYLLQKGNLVNWNLFNLLLYVKWRKWKRVTAYGRFYYYITPQVFNAQTIYFDE